MFATVVAFRKREDKLCCKVVITKRRLYAWRKKIAENIYANKGIVLLACTNEVHLLYLTFSLFD